jgi:hypothetical protein
LGEYPAESRNTKNAAPQIQDLKKVVESSAEWRKATEYCEK